MYQYVTGWTYRIIHRTRKNKKGGGVAIYVNDSISFKIIDTMSVVIDDILECVTVELCINKKYNIIVSCIYRTLGTNVDMFTHQPELMIKSIKNTKKTIFLCGDFNIDLLKYNNNNSTKYFVAMLFNLGIYPLIDKPSKITESSATIIDNIFTNELNIDITSGLMINDISDHLPVFCICHYTDLTTTRIKTFRYVRKLTDSCKESLINELSLVN